MGRLVWNHSSHVEGIIPILRRLADMPGIKTVTPGRIRPPQGHGPFRITVSVPISGGWKANGRKAGLAQEIFVVTDLTKEALQAEIDALVE